MFLAWDVSVPMLAPCLLCCEVIYIIKTKKNFLTKQINGADLSAGSVSLNSYRLSIKCFLGQWTTLPIRSENKQ